MPSVTIAKRLWPAFLAANVICILAFWWEGSQSSLLRDGVGALIAFGRLAGLFAAFLILLQFYTIGRSPWLERTYGLDTLSRFHHQTGQWGMLLLLLHPILIVFGYGAASGTGFAGQFLSLLSQWEVLLAGVALILFVLVVASSIVIARRRLTYELWYGVHLVVYVAIVLAFFHQVQLGGTVTGSDLFYGYWLALYFFVLFQHLAYRFLRPLVLLHRHAFFISRVAREVQQVVSLYITGKNMNTFPIQEGQFMILRFLAKGFRWQAHPFSLSMVPDGRHLRVSIKELGDFTRKVPTLEPGTRVLIDGPYGVFTADRASSEKILCIAGGIGITPIRPLLERFVGQGKDAVLLYGNRTEGDIVFRGELDALAKDPRCRVVHILSNQPGFAGETGRLDAATILRLAPDVRERDVFVCGPIAMLASVRRSLRELGVPSARVHHERFAL